MKQNLITIVQGILSDMDSENVNSIDDSVEALQIANVVKDTYFNIIATREMPANEQLLKLVAASDSSFPTHFKYGEDVKEIVKVWYQTPEEKYKGIDFIEPLDFLSLVSSPNGNNILKVDDKNAGTTLFIENDKDPSFYTSFDNEWLVFNSYDKDLENTLQEHKARAYGTKYPRFEISDHHVPDLDNIMFPYLIAEAKSVAMSLFKGGSDPKIEQAARRQKSYMQNDRYKTVRENVRNNYGRR